MATVFEPLEGKYEILDKIREGGMGSVYKVRHRLLDELRVVKVMRPQLADDEVLRARFLREAKVAIKLRHPNLAQIYDFTVDSNGYAYLVMEFIDGLNVEEVIKVLARPALGLMLEIADQSLDAIGYLHRKRIIHRDISPDNLLVTRDEDQRLLVKLIDLGIAKDREVEDSLTSAGTFLGKVRYSSPEHFRTHEGASVGVRSDLYSFGVVLYEMVTGTYPIRGSSVASLITGHLMQPPLPFEESDPDGAIPDGLREVVLKALSKTPDERYDSAADFRLALEPFRVQAAIDDADVKALFEVPTVTTRRIPIVKPGSTQSRMDESFKMQTTPPPAARAGEDDLESSGTVDTGSAPGKPSGDSEPSIDTQIRALLLGAGKLIEGKHFDEARLQLASVLELSPGNSEAARLQRVIDAADRKMQQRRQRAADAIRQDVEAERLDRARAELEKARQNLGPSDLFDELADEIDAAAERRRQRFARLEEIDAEVSTLLEHERYEPAAELLQEAARLDPGNPATAGRLADVEARRADQVELERREHEIERVADRIARHIDHEELDQADRELVMALKVYGSHRRLDELADGVAALGEKLRRDEAVALLRSARAAIDNGEFDAAIASLEQAREVDAGAEEIDELFAAAREGLRLQEEARRRQLAIDEAAARVDRLIAAGRLESAVHLIDETVAAHGDFDQASALRERAAGELQRLEASQDEIQSLIGRALRLATDEQFADAEEALETARETATGRPDLASLVGDAGDEVRRRIEAHRRHMAIDEVTQSIGRQLEKAAVDEARRELSVARRLYGACDPLDEIAARIDARERELRRRQVEELLAAAAREDQPPGEAITALERAVELDAHDERVRQLLAERRLEERRLEDARRAERAADRLREVDRLIGDDQISRALELVDRISSEGGEFPDLMLLRHRLGSGARSEAGDPPTSPRKAR